MTYDDIVAKLSQIKPNAQWVLSGSNYVDLRWDDLIQTKPTKEEIGL